MIVSAAFSADGKTILTASKDSTARFWDAHTGKPIGKPLQHKFAVNAALFSPDGKTAAGPARSSTQFPSCHLGPSPLGKGAGTAPG
jgi:WD40 repeat protein